MIHVSIDLRRESPTGMAVTLTVPSIEARSEHVSHSSVQAFLHHDFDPVDYLNSTLPALSTSSTARNTQNTITSRTVALPELSSQLQALLAKLNAQTSRLSNSLTQLTDEILRSGGRLAYEVEVLRGETLGLSEALTEGLHEDVVKFVPGGLDQDLAKKQSRPIEANGIRRRSSVPIPKTPVEAEAPAIVDPPYIQQLRTLTLVRSRLETVIQTFGDAMAWTFPPSEVSVTSSFLSVSAPEPGSAMHSTEEKGQQILQQFRDDIADLLIRGDPVDGIEAAAKRVEELKELALVWKGTAEEKARIKFVESLAKLVEDRHRDLLRDAEQDTRLRQRVETLEEVEITGDSRTQSGFGFLSQLQKLRGAS